MIEVFGRATSSNVQAVMWTIGELELTHVRHDLGHRFGGLDTPEFRAMNPHGRIPVIRDNGGSPIWETGAILRYLAATYGDEAFWPTEPARRASVDRWAEWAKINVAIGFTVPIFWAVVRTAAAERDEVALARALAGFDRLLDAAETQIASAGFLAAPQFTLADIQFGHLLYRYFDIDIPRPGRPALADYYERLTQRPAFARHVMISYEDLRARDP